MAENTPISANNWTVGQLKLIEWLATPKLDRKPKTQKQLAVEIGTDESTLSDWKKKSGFMDEVRVIAREYLKDELPEIYGALITKAKSGDVPAIKLAMEMTKEFVPSQKIDANITASLRWEDIVKADDDNSNAFA